MRRSVSLILMIYWMSLTGCSYLDGYVDIVRSRGLSEAYQAVLSQWTHSRTIYSEFETKVHISATYRSTAFNQAYLEEESRIRGLDAGDMAKRSSLKRSEQFKSEDFLFYAYVPEKQANDFDRRGSIWTVFLIDGEGNRIDPMEIRRIDPVNAVVTEFFPYVNPHYGVAYQLRFPSLTGRGTSDQAFRLVFSSVIGKVELEYRAQ